MRVSELIDILKDQPQDSEVELAIVAPLKSEEDDDITVDRYTIEGVLPWQDDREEGDTSAEDEGVVIWLVGGEEDDVDAFLDAIEQDQDHDDHDHADGEADHTH